MMLKFHKEPPGCDYMLHYAREVTGFIGRSLTQLLALIIGTVTLLCCALGLTVLILLVILWDFFRHAQGLNIATNAGNK